MPNDDVIWQEKETELNELNVPISACMYRSCKSDLYTASVVRIT